jgi:hypothetical protein
MADETKEREWIPTQGGETTAYKPQWRHNPEWGYRLNVTRGFEGRKDNEWTDIPVVILRGGGVHIECPDGRSLPVGVPFPMLCGGVMETIYLYGHEQAQAMAWSFAAHAAGVGAEIEVRVQAYELHYSIKARVLPDEQQAFSQHQTQGLSTKEKS